MSDGAHIYTVSELTRTIRGVLEEHLARVCVTGEISNFRRPASGHCYFTLKDEFAQINVVMWRSTAAAVKFEMKDGLAVVVRGELTVYEPRGQYQIVLKRVEPLGVGALQLAFMQLKEKLAGEGLFDAGRKKPLPLIPQRIAIITSATGAAIQDMLRVIHERFPPANVLVCPVSVQGDDAAPEIARMIERVNRLPDVDVMIVGRGGGSIEDLWPFNEEIVARAIAASRIPIISAVGHETDYAISDFVADLRALTPTDAANHVVPDARQLADALANWAVRLGRALLVRVASVRERLDSLARSYALRRPLERIRAHEQRLDDLAQQLYRTVKHTLQLQSRRLASAAARLESLSPLAVLARGYSITLRDVDGSVVRNAATLKPGDCVRALLHRGEFRATVVSKEAPPAKPRKTGRAKSAAAKEKKEAHTHKGRKKDGPKQSKI